MAFNAAFKGLNRKADALNRVVDLRKSKIYLNET